MKYKIGDIVIVGSMDSRRTTNNRLQLLGLMSEIVDTSITLAQKYPDEEVWAEYVVKDENLRYGVFESEIILASNIAKVLYSK